MARVGRPTEGASAKRAPLNLKTSPELRERVERSAEAAGLSLTQEVERRLADSYKEEDWLGGVETAALLKGIAADIAGLERFAGVSWSESFEVAFAAALLVHGTMAAFGPPPPNSENLNAANEDLKKKTDELMRIAREVNGKESKALADATEAVSEAERVRDEAYQPCNQAIDAATALHDEFCRARAYASVLRSRT